MKSLDQIALFVVLLVVLCTRTVHAQTDEHESTSDHETTTHHESEHDFHPNLLALFVGLSHAGRRDNGVALGIEYERRFTRAFGVGAVIERTFGDEVIWVYVVPFAYHTGRWKFYVAPGIEDGDHGSESLIRLGGEYAYEVGGWEISPQLDVDIVDGDQVLVWGVTFGKGF